MEKAEFQKRRVDDFEKVDNTLRDMADITQKGEMKECIVKVIGYLYDIFEMPEDGFDEKKLNEIKKRYKEESHQHAKRFVENVMKMEE